MKKVDALLFDLGGVLIDVDYHKTIDAFAQLGVQNPLICIINLVKINYSINTKKEKCLVNFLEQLKPLTKLTLLNLILFAWNAMIGDFPTEKLDFIAGVTTQSMFLLQYK